VRTTLPVAVLAILASCNAACTQQNTNNAASALSTGAADARTGCAVGQAVGAVAAAVDPNLTSTQQAIDAGCADLQQIETTP
jgi:hypothetical protein